ncbi:hypothetical protein ACVRZD_09785 [Streptococcus hongkongensis]|nr:hypothetical protein NC01_08505 [Streptococcus uberis]
MRKDAKMNVRVTKSGYKYYTPRQRATETPQAPKANKWRKGIQWLGKALLAGLKNLPSLLIKVAITPVFLLLFILNLIKSLIATAIGWFVFKVVVGFAVICYYAFLTKEGSAPVGVETWFHDWTFPHGVPIYYWWETTIIVVLAIITALSLTFYSDEI